MSTVMRSEPTAVELVCAHIKRLVECESPSSDRDAVARSAQTVATLGRELLGSEPEMILIDGTTHLRWRFGSRTRVLIVAHHDTVWPIGTLARRPFAVEEGVLTGPGSFDMKAGLVMAFHAVASLTERDGVTILVTGDEEIGSPSSRRLIEREAEGAAAALVLEAAGPNGALKSERKGVSQYTVSIAGRASHAGLEPELGVNATIEVAHAVLAVSTLADPTAGTTVTPTTLSSGSTGNTVPAEAKLSIDVRIRTAAEQERVDRGVRNLQPVLPGAHIEIFGGPNRPPLDRTSSEQLLQRAQRLAARLGLPPLMAIAVGGASDGNFTAGMGIPTLDGLGAVGGGAHAENEHVLIAELQPRTLLLSELIADVLKGTTP